MFLKEKMQGMQEMQKNEQGRTNLLWVTILERVKNKLL
jgi:hypothetical protein